MQPKGKLLGSAVGSAVFQNEVLTKRVNIIANLLDELSKLDCSQTKMHLIRSCFGYPKFNFALRSMNSAHVLIL